MRAGILGGAGVLAVVIVLALSLARPGPVGPIPSPWIPGGPTPAPSAAAVPTVAPEASLSVQAVTQLLNRVLPTPATTDTALLVTDPANLTAAEQQWLADIRANVGGVDALAYRDATTARLRGYFTVFVIGTSPDLDPAALADAFAAGVTVHLVGTAAAYQPAIAAGAGQ